MDSNPYEPKRMKKKQSKKSKKSKMRTLNQNTNEKNYPFSFYYCRNFKNLKLRKKCPFES